MRIYSRFIIIKKKIDRLDIFKNLEEFKRLRVSEDDYLRQIRQMVILRNAPKCPKNKIR